MPNQYSYSQSNDLGVIFTERIENRRFITEDGCWLFLGGTGSKGNYGMISINGEMFKVHRVMAALCLGVNLNDSTLLVLHKCDVPECFNPEHLYIGNEDDNHQDIFDREKFGASFKLTPEDVSNIFKLREAGWTQHKIADSYDVTQGTISRILTGERWSRLNREKVS